MRRFLVLVFLLVGALHSSHSRSTSEDEIMDTSEGHEEAFQDGQLAQVLSGLLAKQNGQSEISERGDNPVDRTLCCIFNSNKNKGKKEKSISSGGGNKGENKGKGQQLQYEAPVQAVSQQYGPPPQNQQQNQYGPPQPPNQQYGPPPVQQQQYGPPPQNLQQNQYGPPPQQNQQYGPPPPNTQYGVMAFQAPLSQAYGPPPQKQQNNNNGLKSYSLAFSFGDRTKPRKSRPNNNHPMVLAPFPPQQAPPTFQPIQQPQLQALFNLPQNNFQQGYNNAPFQNTYLPPPPVTSTYLPPPNNYLPPQNNYLPPQETYGPPPQQEEAQQDNRFVYVYGPPENLEQPQEPLPPQKVPYKQDTHYQVVFIRAPNPPTPQQIQLELPPPPEKRTLIYVLVKKPGKAPEIKFRKPPTTPPPAPEVFFIKYKNNKDLPSTSDAAGGDDTFRTEQIAEKIRAQNEVASGGYGDPRSQRSQRSRSGLPSTSSAFARQLAEDDDEEEEEFIPRRVTTSGRSLGSHYTKPGASTWKK